MISVKLALAGEVWLQRDKSFSLGSELRALAQTWGGLPVKAGVLGLPHWWLTSANRRDFFLKMAADGKACFED